MQTNIPAHVAEEHENLYPAKLLRLAHPRHLFVRVAYLAGIAALMKAFIQTGNQMRHALRRLKAHEI